MPDFTEKSIRLALAQYDNMPEKIVWKDVNHNYVLMNDKTAKLCGFSSSEISFEGISDYDLRCDAVENADEYRKVDKLVMRSKQEVSGLAYNIYSNGEKKLLMGRISPYYDDSKKVIGTRTIAIDVTDCAIMRSVFTLYLSDFDKFVSGEKSPKTNYLFKTQYDDFGLTSRQSEILFLIMRGYTAKEIARVLGLAHRTVENHRETIRLKMNCNTKSEMIAKALEAGLGSVIPKTLISIPMSQRV